MSTARHLRAIRALGGFNAGTSRLARPPAVLEEPDVRPAPVELSGSYETLPLAGQTFAQDVFTAIEWDPTTYEGGQAPGMTGVVLDGTWIDLPAGLVVDAFIVLVNLAAPAVAGITVRLSLFDSTPTEFETYDLVHPTSISTPTSLFDGIPVTIPPGGGFARALLKPHVGSGTVTADDPSGSLQIVWSGLTA